MDAWDPGTFDQELVHLLDDFSELIEDYFREDARLMAAYLNADSYETLQSNQYAGEFLSFREHRIAPLLISRRVRLWHYTRLTDVETRAMKEELVPSTLEGLGRRLHRLVEMNLISETEAQLMYAQSPFHEQADSRRNRLWTVTVPRSPRDSGVVPLLRSWGGEAAYFWISDTDIAHKLTKIGRPRVVEIEGSLSDGLNSFSVAETVLQAWARTLGVAVRVTGSDLALSSSVATARAVRVHTHGDSLYEQIGLKYPEGCHSLLGDDG